VTSVDLSLFNYQRVKLISGPKYEPATSKVRRMSAVYSTIIFGMLALEVVTLERSNDLNKRQVWLRTRQAMYV